MLEEAKRFQMLEQDLGKEKKSHIREKLNLSMCTDRSTDTKRDRNRQKGKNSNKYLSYVSGVTCQVSSVMSRVSPVTCQLSLTPKATATDPPRSNSPTTQSKLVLIDPKT